MHFPLQEGDEVLLSCLNGDPDRPMIVGSHYDAAHHSPVTNVNPSENRLRTKADNELIMDDKVDHEIIKLRTYEGYNILQFDAKKAEHMLRLASEQGAMHRYAKQTHHHKSGDTHEERVGNDRIQVVENKSVTQTKNKDIHHQTPTDLLQNAGTTIKHTAQDNIEITANENQIIVVEDENMEITVEGPGGFRIHIKNDALHIQSAKETRIEGNGGGDITLHQSGGGVCVTAGGNIKLFGNDIQIEGDNGVSLNGTVRYTIGSGGVPAPPIDPALMAQSFALIKAAIMGKPFVKICEKMSQAITIYDLNWSQPRVPVREPVKAMFQAKNVNGGEQAEINVYEWDPDGSKELIKTLSLELEPDIQEYSIEFTREEDDTDSDLKKDRAANDHSPLSYRFEVVVDGQRSKVLSGILNLTSDMTFDLVDKHDRKLEGLFSVEVIQADGESLVGETSTSSITFLEVLLGPIELHTKPVTKDKKQ
ncbi:hypothetical protein MNBD_GAMMA12-3918 [hydrothermal vent metagenome]|uniref:VgrG protein n=1 Tax=hydrothermal vent metagenome TaxID=652676 RepID=A0A3B0YNB8_9ZZZZ